MRKLLATLAAALALAALFVQTSAQAGDMVVTDTWNGKDKPDHLVGSAALGLASAALVTDARSSATLREWGCGTDCQRWALALVPGVAKEAWDSRRGGPGNWSWKDMLANGVGAYLGVKLGGWIFTPRGVVVQRAF